jgi:hypothetical protein
MNRFIKTGIATGLAAITLTGAFLSPAFARSHDAVENAVQKHDEGGGADNAAPHSGGGGQIYLPAIKFSDVAAIDREIRNWHNQRFDVVAVDEQRGRSGADVIVGRADEHGYLPKLHATIADNRKLAARLEARNVEIRNVIGAEAAADGTMTFYVR